MERQKLGLVRRLLPANLGPNTAVSIPPLASLHDKAKEAAEADRIVSRASQAAKELAKQTSPVGSVDGSTVKPKRQRQGYRSSERHKAMSR